MKGPSKKLWKWLLKSIVASCAILVAIGLWLALSFVTYSSIQFVDKNEKTAYMSGGDALNDVRVTKNPKSETWQITAILKPSEREQVNSLPYVNDPQQVDFYLSCKKRGSTPFDVSTTTSDKNGIKLNLADGLTWPKAQFLATRINVGRYTHPINRAIFCAFYNISNNFADEKTTNAKAYDRIQKIVSAADLEYGEMQLRTMLKGRPKMLECVKPGDPVWNWTVRQFAGEGTGARISFDSEIPELLGKSMPQTKTQIGSISIQSHTKYGAPIDGERLWSTAVFELLNVRNGDETLRLFKLVRLGKITRSQWIHDIAKFEYETGSEQMSFYRKVWVPNAFRNHCSANQCFWGDNRKFDVWYKSMAGSNYIKAYEKYYDSYILPDIPKGSMADLEMKRKPSRSQ